MSIGSVILGPRSKLTVYGGTGRKAPVVAEVTSNLTVLPVIYLPSARYVELLFSPRTDVYVTSRIMQLRPVTVDVSRLANFDKLMSVEHARWCHFRSRNAVG